MLSFSNVRIAKLMKRLMGRTCVEDALQRLDRLTQEETRTTVAKSLEVTHSIKDSASRTAHLLTYFVLIMFPVMLLNSRREDEPFVAPQRCHHFLLKLTLVRRQSVARLPSKFSPSNPSMNHNIACGTRHEGTATWFINGGPFKEWKSSYTLLAQRVMASIDRP
jgi:hypothetical protein